MSEIDNNARTIVGDITVSSRIIDQLSSGLYLSPAACLKELINNAYDADAGVVNVSVRPDADLIIIADDGVGMSAVDFEKHFKRIARSYKRESSDTTQKGRPKIGKIGIGFIAANEICEKLEVISTKKGSTELLQVTLDFGAMRQDIDERERVDGDVLKGDFSGTVSDIADIDDHYTRLFLSEVKGEAQDFLSGAKATVGEQSLYGLSTDSVRDKLMRSSMRTWDELDVYSRTILEIAENIPVRYHREWASSRSGELSEFSERADALDFTVIVDGTDLRKPVVLRDDDGATLLQKFDLKGQHVSARGYMFSYDHKLSPMELNGVLVRIRNSAVGRYDSHYLEYPAHLAPLLQDWASIELYADDRLEDALNIDRRTLRVTHPAFVELQELFHAELARFFSATRKNLYGTRSDNRKKEIAAHQADKLRDLSTRSPATPPAVASSTATPSRDTATSDVPFRIAEITDPNSLSKPDIRALTKSYLPSEIVEIVADAGREANLGSEDIDNLIAAVLKRLGLQ